MKIPFFDLKRQYSEISNEIENSVIDVLRSGQYIEGKATKDFEKHIAQYLGVKYAISCGNGTDALRIALQAAGVRNGDEVITTSFSFFATAESIQQIGAIPVFADIDPETFNIDINSIKEKISKKTKAILPVHIFGLPADMDEINSIAREYKIPVIEDACQAIGAEYKGHKAGNLGTIGCFSFYPTKNLGGMGDGGLITTNDDNIANVCLALKAHAAGKNGANAYRHLYDRSVLELELFNSASGELYDPCKYFNYLIGWNSRLDSVQAAILNAKLKYLDEYNNKRETIAKKYNEGLKQASFKTPEMFYHDRKSCWHQYCVLSENKGELIKYLADNNIGVGTFYPVPLHLQKAFRDLEYKEGDLPASELICKQSVCLPIFPELKEEEVDFIIQIINKF